MDIMISNSSLVAEIKALASANTLHESVEYRNVRTLTRLLGGGDETGGESEEHEALLSVLGSVLRVDHVSCSLGDAVGDVHSEPGLEGEVGVSNTGGEGYNLLEGGGAGAEEG